MVAPNPDARIYVSKDGQWYGPYTAVTCRDLIGQHRLSPLDHACQLGEALWRPLSEVLAEDERAGGRDASASSPQPGGAAPTPSPQTAGDLVAQMGCGCVLWIGLIVLATTVGIFFPVLLIVLPILLVGMTVDLVRRFLRIGKGQGPRQM
jgi:hypothetical protein